MQPKENNKESDSKSKKNLRETNSYQIQFQNRKNKKSKDNKLHNHNYKSNYNTIYSSSNYSTKTFNQKRKPNFEKNNKELDAQSINNLSEIEKNAISYSNFVYTDLNAIIKKEKNKSKNISNFGIIKNNDKELGKNEIKNLKMDIKELSDSQNLKNNDNNINFKEEKAKISYENQAVKYNINQKIRKSLENIDYFDKPMTDINKKQFINLKNENKIIKKQKSSKIFNKMNKAKDLRNIKRMKKNLEIKSNKTQKINLIEDEKNNYIEEAEIIKNKAYNNHIKHNNLPPQNQINNYNQKQETKFNNKITKNELLFNEINEKFSNLYTKITGKKENSKNDETINNLEENKLFRITYPNLKRYRQKTDPNLRKNTNNNININNEINEEENTNKIKYPKIIKDNNNLSKFKKLEEKIKNENSTKRMINTLLNKQKSPELKEILSNLQITMGKFPKNEERKDNNYLSTLPANYLSPFDTFKFEENNYKNKKLIFEYNVNNNYKTETTNYNQKKLEKFKSTFNDFKKIINGKNKSKTRNDSKYSYQTKIIYSNLSPANDLVNDIFILDS